MPLPQVLEEPTASKAKIRTPKQVAELSRDKRTHGQRVYDSTNALDLWMRIDGETPSGPMGPETVFGAAAIMLAKLGRSVCQRSFVVSLAE